MTNMSNNEFAEWVRERLTLYANEHQGFSGIPESDEDTLERLLSELIGHRLQKERRAGLLDGATVSIQNVEIVVSKDANPSRVARAIQSALQGKSADPDSA